MISGKKSLAGATILAGMLVLGWPAGADNPAHVYYISMRGLTTEAAPSFVVVSREQTSQRTATVTGCGGHNYYATPADAATVSTARANGEVVQLHRGQEGGTAQSSSIVCIIDASGS